MRVVLDTSVIVAGLRSRTGASSAILRRAAMRQLVPLVTPPLFLEYEEVLKRAENRLATKLDLNQVDVFLEALASSSEAVEIRFRWRPQLADPEDEMVLEAAVNGRAEALVTHNVRDFLQGAKRFGVEVKTPRELLTWKRP